MSQTRNITQRVLMARLRAERAGKQIAYFPLRQRNRRPAREWEPNHRSANLSEQRQTNQQPDSTFNQWLRTKGYEKLFS